MSAFSHLLRRAFSTTTTTTTPANFKLIFKQRDLKSLVDTFKTQAQDPLFRQKASYYDYTIDRLIRAKKFNLIEELLEDQKKYVEDTKEGFSVRLICLYGKSGLFDRAHKVFDEMSQRNCERTVKSFNALLGACVHSKRFDKIDGIFRDLPKELGIKPDVVSYNTVIKGFCDMGSMDSAALFVEEMKKEGVQPDLITFNTLLHGLYKKDRFLDGEKMWDLMGKFDVVPDIISYNMRLFGLVSEKNIQEAVELVQEIRSKGLKADVYTYNFLFKGLCSDGKYLDEVKRWYIDMMKAEREPNIATFAALLPYACEHGDFQFGARLCRKLFYRRFWLRDVSLVQKVIDGLVKQSNVNEAELLVRLSRENKHSCYHGVKLPEVV